MMHAFDIDLDLEHANASELRDEFEEAQNGSRGRKKLPGSIPSFNTLYRSPSGRRRLPRKSVFVSIVIVVCIILITFYYATTTTTTTTTTGQEEQEQQQQGQEETPDSNPLSSTITTAPSISPSSKEENSSSSSPSSSTFTTEFNDQQRQTQDPTVALLPQLELFSPAFDNDDVIPVKYGRKGGNVSPPFQWSLDVNENSFNIQSWAFIMDDPDAPSSDPWAHWILYNIPVRQNRLMEGAASSGNLPEGTITGINSWGLPQYDGPQPPSGIHHYQFHLYGLTISQIPVDDGVVVANNSNNNTKVLSSNLLTRKQLLQEIQDHIYTETIMVGTFASS